MNASSSLCLYLHEERGATVALFEKKKQNTSLVPVEHLPRHVGIIMDGNGRWAKKRGLPRTAGHVQGAAVFKELSLYCADRGVKAVTFYAFSTENWKRPAEEVSAIMELLRQYLVDALENFRDKNVRVRMLGDLSPLPQNLKDMIREVETSYRDHTGMILNIALNYGSRAEILHSVKNIAERVKDGALSPEDVTEQTIEDGLYTADQPPLDLVIRPSGEQRLSNFLMWQAAYAELWFSDILWPDFTADDLEEAFRDYEKRNRRFGGL